MNFVNSDIQTAEKTNNLRAIFEILAYLHVDAKRDGYGELSERLEFAMNHAEQKLNKIKSAQTIPPVQTNSVQN